MKRCLSLLCVLLLLCSMTACTAVTSMRDYVSLLPDEKPILDSSVTAGTTDAATDATATTTEPSDTTDATADNSTTLPDPTDAETTASRDTSTTKSKQSTTTKTTTAKTTKCKHTYALVSSVPATCAAAGRETYTCSKCRDTYDKEIKAKSHTVVVAAAVTPTETASGLTEGRSCSACGTVLTPQKTIAPYLQSCNDDFAYGNLAKQANGTAKQTLYTRIDTEAQAFHTGSADANNGVAFTVNFADLGLTMQDALQVWLSYRHDHPLYFWISATLNYTADSLDLLVAEDYTSGATRTAVKERLYKKIPELVAAAADETSAYQIAMAYHDAIVSSVTYATDENGNPSQAAWAHNIVGVMEKGSGVCESYAHTFQLLLNVSGIENIFVSGLGGSGDSSEDHAWNLIKLDDGQWYWCDLTWDDKPDWTWGYTHNHFCVTDSQDTNWLDDADPQPPVTFMENHRIGEALDQTMTWEVTLPARATKPYAGKSDVLLRDTFTVGDGTYSVNGYRTVQLLQTTATGAYRIPETVTYKGYRYTVISVGGVRDDGLYSEMGTSVLNENITKVHIPKTVRFLWGNAVRFYNVTEYTVDAANPYFTSVNGVLFTKKLYTLIQYPPNAPKITRYVIPDATGRIAYNAFDGLNNPFEELVFGKGLTAIGMANWGAGYLDGPPTGWFGGNHVVGNMGALASNSISCNGKFKITVSASNPNFAVINGVLYECTNGVPHTAVSLADSNITSVTLPSTVKSVESQAFNDAPQLSSVILNKELTNFDSYVFANCPKLTKLQFQGTMAQWNALESGYSLLPVVCSDGTA